METRSGESAVARRSHDALLIAAGVALLAVTSWMATADTISGLEEDVFRYINEWPDWIEKPLWPVMQAGAVLVVPLCAIVVMAVWRERRLAAALLVSGGVAWVVAKVVKEIIGRGRPAAFLENVIERPNWTGLGFVSGHATVAFALATVASPYVRGRWKWLLWALPVATSILRIYTGGHLPLDVVGGAGLGVAIGGAVNMTFRVPSGASGAPAAQFEQS